jgi:hypothetical protein
MNKHSGQASWRSSMDMQHRNPADRQHDMQWTGSMDTGTKHGHERPSRTWICSSDWKCSTDMDIQHQNGHATSTWTFSLDIDMQHRHGHAALTRTFDMDLKHGHEHGARARTYSTWILMLTWTLR